MTLSYIFLTIISYSGSSLSKRELRIKKHTIQNFSFIWEQLYSNDNLYVSKNVILGFVYTERNLIQSDIALKRSKYNVIYYSY